MARWFGPPSGDCSCCSEAGGTYGQPWSDFGDAAFRFSGWDLLGATDSNTDEGTLYGIADFNIGTFTTSVRLYSDSGRTQLVSEFQTPGTPAPGIINFGEQNDSGLTGSVFYSNPLASGSQTFGVTGTPVT